MSAGAGAWTERLAGAAEADFEAILLWTLEHFGDAQTRADSDILSAAVHSLNGGPEQPGIKARPEIGRDLFTLHTARCGRRGRHFVSFRADAGSATRQIDVLRILHDSMDLARHVPGDE